MAHRPGCISEGGRELVVVCPHIRGTVTHRPGCLWSCFVRHCAAVPHLFRLVVPSPKATAQRGLLLVKPG